MSRQLPEAKKLMSQAKKVINRNHYNRVQATKLPAKSHRPTMNSHSISTSKAMAKNTRNSIWSCKSLRKKYLRKVSVKTHGTWPPLPWKNRIQSSYSEKKQIIILLIRWIFPKNTVDVRANLNQKMCRIIFLTKISSQDHPCTSLGLDLVNRVQSSCLLW